ncbi:glutaredoxin family protein [Massilia sp. GCM10020059]|uniref:Glutaredoxin family protein n=1 Tax=Massilia agrisoli TaxID=2892444 RepID=A0ABS8ITF7_9BURK|nr:glutaredoxin family protein [Massilia agrisoli]MCC6071171.1 glutaredoxin family protein [Massilia agrisoli]
MKVAKMVPAAVGVVLLLAGAGASAQIYKWVDAKGVTHYSDTPPASKQAEVKAYGGKAATLVPLPYELARAVRAAPVTLYTIAKCKACDDGRALLKARGVPFSEKTVTTAADQEKLKEAGSDGQLPLLLVGRSKLLGFQLEAWNSALTNASYPATSMLPSRYRYAEAVAAAPVAAGPSPEELAREAARAAQSEAAATAARDAEAREKKKTNTAPAFQF